MGKPRAGRAVSEMDLSPKDRMGANGHRSLSSLRERLRLASNQVYGRLATILCQLRATDSGHIFQGRIPLKPLDNLVAGTGLEPVTFRL